MAAVIHILLAKQGGRKVSVGQNQLFEYFERYRLELALEEVSRRTNIKCESATLNSIFTDRNVQVQG